MEVGNTEGCNDNDGDDQRGSACDESTFGNANNNTNSARVSDKGKDPLQTWQPSRKQQQNNNNKHKEPLKRTISGANDKSLKDANNNIVTFGEYVGSGKALREIYAESCKRFVCKKNSGLYETLSSTPGDYDSLFEIDLSSNVIGCRGVMALLQVVAVCRSLRKLGLRGNSLDHRCVLHIIDVAKTHKSLQKLDLSHNRIGTCGKAVYELLRINSHITDVALDNTYIDAYMLKKISERLSANRQAASLKAPPSENEVTPPTETAPKVIDSKEKDVPKDTEMDQNHDQSTSKTTIQPGRRDSPPPTTQWEGSSCPPVVTPSLVESEHIPSVVDHEMPKEDEPQLAVSLVQSVDDIFPDVWWESAVPIESGEILQPAPQLDGNTTDTEDWGRFPLSGLYSETKYDSYVPVAAKLLQLATANADIGVKPCWGSSSLAMQGSSSQLINNRELSTHSTSSEGMSVLDYSDATSLHESIKSLDDDRSIHTSEVSDDELGEAQGQLPPLQWPDDVFDDGTDPDVEDDKNNEDDAEDTEPIFQGATADEVLSLPPQQLESQIAKGVLKLSSDKTGLAACYEGLHEKRLAILNLIFSAAVPKVLRTPTVTQHVYRLPGAGTDRTGDGQFQRPVRGTQGLRTESERMSMLYSLLDHAASSNTLNNGLTESMSAAVLQSLHGLPPFCLSSPPSSVLSSTVFSVTPSQYLPAELVSSIYAFLSTSARALESNLVTKGAGSSHENTVNTLRDISCGLVKLAVARAMLRDVLTAVTSLSCVPKQSDLSCLRQTYASLLSVVPKSSGLLLPIVNIKASWSAINNVPPELPAPPEQLLQGVTAVSENIIIGSINNIILLMHREHDTTTGNLIQVPYKVVSSARCDASVCGLTFISQHDILLVSVTALARNESPTGDIDVKGGSNLCFVAYKLRSESQLAYFCEFSCQIPLRVVYGLLSMDSADDSQLSFAVFGEHPETRHVTLAKCNCPLDTLCEKEPVDVDIAMVSVCPSLPEQNHIAEPKVLKVVGSENGIQLGTKSGRYSFSGEGSRESDPQPFGNFHNVSIHSVASSGTSQSSCLTIEVWAKVDLGAHPITLVALSSYSSEVLLSVAPTDCGVEVRGGYVLGRGPAASVEVRGSLLQNWCHFALSYKNHSWYLYINGDLHAASPPCTSSPRMSDKQWCLGAGMRGYLLDMRVWKVARTLTEIQRDMCTVLQGDEPDLVVYFPLNEGDGQIVADVVSWSRVNCDRTPRSISESWHSDDPMLGICLSQEHPIEWVSGVSTPLEGTVQTPSVVFPGAFLPPESYFGLIRTPPAPPVGSSPSATSLPGNNCSRATQVFGTITSLFTVGIAMPDSSSIFGELAHPRMSTSGMVFHHHIVMELTMLKTGNKEALHVTSHCPGGSKPKTELHGSGNTQVRGRHSLGGGDKNLLSQGECLLTYLPSGSLLALGAGSTLLVTASHPKAPLCSWPDSELLGNEPLEDPISLQNELIFIPPTPQLTSLRPNDVIHLLLSAVIRFVTASTACDGLCFSIPMVTDVCRETFQLLSSIPITQTTKGTSEHIIQHTWFRLAALNLTILLRANVSPETVGVTGDTKCILRKLVRSAECILSSASSPQIIKYSAMTLLVAYAPILQPTALKQIRFVMAQLTELLANKHLVESSSVYLLASLKQLSEHDDCLSASIREVYQREFAAAGSPQEGDVPTIQVFLNYERILLQTISKRDVVSLSIRKASCKALQSIQWAISALAVALQRCTGNRDLTSLTSPTALSSLQSSDLSNEHQQQQQQQQQQQDSSASDEGLFFMKRVFFPFLRDLFSSAVTDLRVITSGEVPSPSILTDVFPSFVSSLPLLNGYSEEFLKGLKPLLPLFTEAAENANVRESEKKLVDGSAAQQRTSTVQRVVQAMSTQGDTIQVHKVCVPGASSLQLIFDDSWYLSGESLVAYLPGRDPELEGEPFGCGRAWPEEPVVFAGTDTIIFQFDPSNGIWESGIRHSTRSTKRGFRIIVTGVVHVHFPSVDWLHDVILSLVYTTARLCHSLTSSYSVPCTPIDDALAPWIQELSLDSDSYRRPHEFWVSLIEDVDEGSKLIQMLVRKNLPTAQPHLGGEAINRTLRAIFASLLCHLGVCPRRLQKLVAAEEDQLPRLTIRLWRRVEELRHWLLEVRQKSRNKSIVQLQGGDSQNMTSADNVGENIDRSGCQTPLPQPEQQLHNSDPVDEAFGRAWLLLSHPPPQEITTSLRQAGQVDGNPLLATASLADLMRAESTTDMNRRMSNTWKRAIGSFAVTRLRRMMRKSRNATLAATTPERREASLLQLIQDERITLSLFNDFVSKRKLLARRRLSAISCFEKLIFEYSSTSPGALNSTNSGLVSAFIRSIKGFHYLDNLASCGREMEAAIQSNVYSIVARLAQRLSNDISTQEGVNTADEQMLERVELFLDLMSCSWRGADYGFVLRLDVVSSLRQLFSRRGLENQPLDTKHVLSLRHKSWQVLQLLALRAAMETNSSGTGSVSSPNLFSFGDAALPTQVNQPNNVVSSESPALTGVGGIRRSDDPTSPSVTAVKKEDSVSPAVNPTDPVRRKRTPEGNDDSENEAETDECIQISFLRRVMNVASEELQSHSDDLTSLHSAYTGGKKKLSTLRAKLDEVEHRMRVEQIKGHLLLRHGSGKSGGSRRNSPSIDNQPKSPIALSAREIRRRLRGPIKKERDKLKKIHEQLTKHSTLVSSYLALSTALTTASPAVMLELISDVQLLSIVFRLLVQFDHSESVVSEVWQNGLAFLRVVLPHIAPTAADEAIDGDTPTPEHPVPCGTHTITTLLSFASSHGLSQLHQRSKIVYAYLNSSVERSTTRLFRILLSQEAWQPAVLHVMLEVIKEPFQCWVRRKSDGEVLLPSEADLKSGSAKEDGHLTPSKGPDKKLRKRQSLRKLKDSAEETAGEESLRRQSDEGGDSPNRLENNKTEDDQTYTSASEDVTAESDREARKKARKIQRRRSRIQRRLEVNNNDTDNEQVVATGFTKLNKIHQKRLDIALSVLGGGEIRIQEGRLATCRLRRGARQHVILQKINGTMATVVPVTANGSYIVGNNIRLPQPSAFQLVDVMHNPPREVHTDRLMVGVADMICPADYSNPDVVLAVTSLFIKMLEPAASLKKLVSHHPQPDTDIEPLLQYPTLKLSQLKRRISLSKFLPSTLRAMLAGLSRMDSQAVPRVLETGLVTILMRLCSTRIETSDPVRVCFQHLGEMCTLINWVLPHRSQYKAERFSAEEEGDDLSDRDEFDDGGEEDDDDDDDGDDDVEMHHRHAEHEALWHHPTPHHVPHSVPHHSDSKSKKSDSENESSTLPDVMSEYHFATFLEGTDEGISDDDAWEGYSDAPDSDDEDAFIVSRRTEVLRRLCVETDIRREAWKFDTTLACAFAARCVLQLLSATSETDSNRWTQEVVGPPLLVLKFIARGATMAYRGQLDQDSLNIGICQLLKRYSARHELCDLLVSEALVLLDGEYTGPHQCYSFHMGILLLEAVLGTTEHDSTLSEELYSDTTIKGLISHAHVSVGWRRRQLIMLLTRVIQMSPKGALRHGILTQRLSSLDSSYRRQLLAESEAKIGTGESLSMFLQSFVGLMHSLERLHKEECPTADSDGKVILPGMSHEAAMSVGVQCILSIFDQAAEAFVSSGDKGDEYERREVTLPSILVKDLPPPLPDCWMRYGGPVGDIIPVGVGITARGMWHDQFTQTVDGDQVNVHHSFQSTTSGQSNNLPWHKKASSSVPTSDHTPAHPVASILLSGGHAKTRVESFHNFATVMGSITVGPGSWYWELEVEVFTLIQVGWVESKDFTCDSETGHGVGDDLHSWAYDGIRNCVWHARQSEPYANNEVDLDRNRDCEYQRRRRAAERRKRRRQKARRKRRMNTSQMQPVVQQEADRQTCQNSDGWEECDADDASTEGDWGCDDGALLSGDGIDEDSLIDDEAIHSHWKTGDVIGCKLVVTPDMKATISFAHNGTDLGDAFKDVLISHGLNPAISLRQGDSVIINMGGAAFKYCPEGYRGVSDPLTWLPSLLDIESATCTDTSYQWKPFKELASMYCDAWHKSVGYGAMGESGTPEDRKRPQPFEVDDVTMYNSLSVPSHSYLSILSRFSVIARIAASFVGPESTIPPVLGYSGSSGVNDPSRVKASLLGRLMSVRNVLFSWAKESLLEGSIAGACSEGRVASILLSRNYFSQRSEGNGAAGAATAATEETLFDQLHALYRSKRPWAFRNHESCDASARLWTVVFEGEAAEDAGGPFRESLTTVCEELMEETPNGLFISSPNYKGNFGEIRDKSIPRPCLPSHSVEHKMLLSKFRFLGRLMAGCISINEPMDLSLSSIVWKSLTNTEFDRTDLASIDQMCLTALDGIVNIEGITADFFRDAIDECFITTLSDGQEVELIPNGMNTEVTYDNRDLYARLVISHRLNESAAYLKELKEGFTDVLPPAVLDVITWKELERRVCGFSGISVSELKRSAIYEDIDELSPTVQIFWAALESFTQKDLTNLLRFVAARSRLPVAIKIQPYVVDSDPDQYLPQAHTCFFSMELPAYSSVEVMRSKLLYAIYNCRAIDTDGSPVGLGDMDGDEEEDDEMEFDDDDDWE